MIGDQKASLGTSCFEYASHLVLEKNKDGSTQVCVDYRKIKQMMMKDEHPLPLNDDQIEIKCIDCIQFFGLKKCYFLCTYRKSISEIHCVQRT